MKSKIIIAAASVSITIVAQSFIINIPNAKKLIEELRPKLSEYHIYLGNPSDLTPTKEFLKYELASTLFTDYAEKSRLIKVPAGTKLEITNNGLPQFPDGTILVKTFYYWNDKRDTTKGKRIIETRILLKANNEWQAGTYVWNIEQTEAVLTAGGMKANVSWLDEKGTSKEIAYKVPSVKQCGSCHNSNNRLNPVGFKVQNLNINVPVNNTQINQLKYFSDKGITNKITPSSFATLPAWNNNAYSLEQRVRAYLEVNCAHCHNENGFCAASGFRPGFENSLSETKIPKKGNKILKFLKSGRMPLLGTTVIHQEAVQLIEEYLKSVKQR